MADTTERRKNPRKPAQATPKPDSKPTATSQASMPMAGGAASERSSEDTRPVIGHRTIHTHRVSVHNDNG